jgi:surfactin synthase thioesterase subunit
VSRSLLRPLPRPRAARTLLCLSFCGGGTAVFRPWVHALPDDVELALYCYPGRESRFGTPFAADWDGLISDALEGVRSIAGRPYALMGHSMGAWVAFDLARRAPRAAVAPPEALIASGADAPSHWQQVKHAVPGPDDTDGALLDWMIGNEQIPEELRGVPDVLRMAVDLLRADMRIVDSYRYRDGERAPVPVQVLYGEQDGTEEGAERWRLLSPKGFEATRLPGGHFYTPEVWSRLPEHVTWLRPHGSGTTTGGAGPHNGMQFI